ncbi:MAG: histidine kinase [Lachnospiraceae bacterium]|nr:histidine kinase [Lachnospiraceae bacterium]
MNLQKCSLFLSTVAVAAVAILLVMLCVTDNAEVSQSRTGAGYFCVEADSCEEVKDANAPIGVKKKYTFFLNKTVNQDTCLAFYTVHQYVTVYLDGEPIYSLQPSGKNCFSQTVGSNWTMIPLYRKDAGKEILVEITPVYESFRNREVEFLVGSQLAIYRDRLVKDLPQLILGIMAVFVGIVFVCVASYNMIKKKRGKSLAALGMFSAMLGLWRLTDTRFTPFIMPEKPIFLFYVSVTMLGLGVIPLLKWAEEYFSQKSRRVLDCYCILAALLCLVQVGLQLLAIKDWRDTLFATHIVIAGGVILIIGCFLYERVTNPEKPKILLGKKLAFICVAGVIADVVAFYVKGNSSGLVFSLLAFLLYIVFMGIATMYNYSEQEVQLAEMAKELAEKERKLTERRIVTMMSQIRSHFIFNLLTTISGYCKIDPQKADNALIRFSRYLRKNINIIEQEGLIAFSSELEQLEDYIALEQMRFENMITFSKDIEVTNFQIPPLTIQPIVENAIKHGLVEHDRSGNVILQTVREGKFIVITVTDDGVGFVPENVEEEKSVGIRNVRYRLENMVNGSLAIESVLGTGTIVTIRIPTKEEVA